MTQYFLVVDRHPLFRDGLRSAIHDAYPTAEVLEASTINSGQTASPQMGHLRMVLLGIESFDRRPFDDLLELRSRLPDVTILAVASRADNRTIDDALAFGASGVISKSAAKSDFIEAILNAASGAAGQPRPSKPAGAQLPSTGDIMKRCAALTPQQVRVMLLMRQGLLNKQIAYELNVGETTVKAHVSEILRKLNVASRTQAVIETSKIDFDNFRGMSPLYARSS